jgi:hypothetical protein
VVATSGSESIPHVATRLQGFRPLIVEMIASFLDREIVFDAGGRNEKEIERLLRLLEDVMKKVRGLAETDAILGASVPSSVD